MDIIINERSTAHDDSDLSLYDQHHFYLHALSCLDPMKDRTPLAQFFAAQHQLAGEWMIVSPIHWEATHNDAMIAACGKALGLDDAEGRAWFLALEAFTREDGWRWFYHDAYTWLVQTTNHALPTAAAVYHMLNKSLMPAIQSLDTHGYWQRVFTELQMFCSSHILNAKRIDLLPVNGVWFWGMGVFWAQANKQVITDDAQLYQWCQSVGQQTQYFSNTSTFNKADILALNQASSLDLSNVKKAIQQNDSHWFWLNHRHSQVKSSWWRRILGR